MGQRVNVCHLEDGVPRLFSKGKDDGLLLLGLGNIWSLQCTIHLKTHRQYITTSLYEEGESEQSGHY